MKTALTGLAVVIILALAGGLILYSLDTYSEHRARIESREMAVSLTDDTLRHWSAEHLLHNGDALFLQEMSEPVLHRYVAALSQLGALQALEVESAELQRPAFWYWQQEIRADFVMAASFSGGPASVEISLIRRNGQWMVSNFLVQASFMPA